jgi:hypothetical protein
MVIVVRRLERTAAGIHSNVPARMSKLWQHRPLTRSRTVEVLPVLLLLLLLVLARAPRRRQLQLDRDIALEVTAISPPIFIGGDWSS